MTTNEKLALLQAKIERTEKPITVLIIGLGSVGLYLLDYLVELSDPRLRLVVAGRNAEKLQRDVNIVRTAAAIRRRLCSEIVVEAGCDLENVDSITTVLKRWQPDFLVNSSRVYPGLKYGTISWHNLRAYGIWAPLSIRYARNIMKAYDAAGCTAISINTSYSDAVIPWLKSAGKAYFDFGSGNLNHLIPRMKFYIAEKFGIDDLNDIDVTLAVSHFHDVVISKEGQAESQEFPLRVRYRGEVLEFNRAEMLRACMIPMPTDQKRNMMNASSNFNIIDSILRAIYGKTITKFHTPGVGGEIGGFPYVVDAMQHIESQIDTSEFSLDEMRSANRASIYLDGIADIRNGSLYYTPELIAKVASVFGKQLPSQVAFDRIDVTGEWLIEQIIKPNIG